MFWRRKDKSTPQTSETTSVSFDAVPASFPPKTEKDRAALLQFIQHAPIAHGPWQGFKQLFKAIEAQPAAETELLAAMLLRIDDLPMGLPVMGNSWSNDVPEGGPRASWNAGERRLTVRDKDGQEGSLTFGGYGTMAQVGTLALVTGGDYNKAQLNIVNIADATQPTVQLKQELKNIYSYNALAYAARRGDYLFICFNLSNPYNNVQLTVYDVSSNVPVEVSSIRLGQAYNFQAALDGEHLFFIGGDWNRNQLKFVDVSNVHKLKISDGVDLGNLGWGNGYLTAKDGLAYVAIVSRTRGIKVIDGRNASQLREMTTLKVPGLTSVLAHEGRVYARVDPSQIKDNTEKSRFRLIDASNPDKPKLLGAPPSSRTVGYMKRRARRLLWKLATKNANLYVNLATRLIQANVAELNYADSWLSVDAILGQSGRFQQRRHGRAGYAKQGQKFVFKSREERFASLWDAHLDMAHRLWRSHSAPIEAREMALKILRANGQEIPSLDVDELTNFLSAPSPILQSYATRLAAQQIENGGTLNGKTAALALLDAPANLRSKLENWAANFKWSKEERRAFGLQLQRAVAENRSDGKDAPWRRRNYAARLLAGAWNEFLDQNALLENLPFWVRLGDDQIMARVRAVLREAGKTKGAELAAHLSTIARQIAKIDEAQREDLLQEFLKSASSRAFTGTEALSLVSQDDIAALGWRILDEANLPLQPQEFMWNALFRGHALGQEALRLAFSSPAAISVFQRGRLDRISDKLRAWTETNQTPFLHGSLQFFDALLAALPESDHARVTFRALALMSEENANAVWENHADLAAKFAPQTADFQRANFYNYSIEPGLRAWDFLAASQVSSQTLIEMWMYIFRMAQWGNVRRAFSAEAAPDLLRRAQFSSDVLEEMLRQFPRVWELASPQFYLAILDILPAAGRLQRLLETTDERWTAAREAVLQSLNEPSGLVKFWTAVWERMKSGDEVLKARLLDDEAIVSTFERIEAQSFEPFLKTDDPTHEPWILRWFKAHKPEKGDELLLLAATHNLPGVREWGLGRAEYLRLDLASALRLLESDLPECIAAGRKFFEAVESGSDDEKDYALALCDSPGYAARGYGREFIEARRETLFSGDLLGQLAQGSAPDMQAWLAEKLLEKAAPQEATQTFDAAVLRARGRARKAKNLVQTRYEQNSAPEAKVDNATLLEIARSRTPRDAEWALRQLAERTLAGEKIEGVEIVS